MLHQVFEEVARNYPDNIALQFEDQKPYTYKQLNAFANQLAREFLAQGIKLQEFVPVMLERSAEQVVVLLALSKIGAVYVPVTPEQPTRLQQILTDCKPSHLIVSRRSTSSPPALSTICMAELTAGIAKQPASNLNQRGLHEDLICYVAGSSGTTGRTKFMPLCHRGLTEYWSRNLAVELRHQPTHVLANCSADFDAHIWEYLMAWVFGALLQVTAEETRKNALMLAEFIKKHRITDMTLTPAVLREFNDAQFAAFARSGLKAIYSTGDACTREIVSKCERYGIKIYNCYGPTETTFGLSMLLCSERNFHQNLAPIALPPPDSKVSVKIVDDLGKEVPEGMPGELVIISPYICGVNAKPGYLNQESTQFKKLPGGFVAYHTGDKFVRQNGYLYYQGRNGHLSNVKIRGQLVDPKGTEEVLRGFPKIKDVYVTVEANPSKESVLVAYIVADGVPSLTALRQFCYTAGLSTASIPQFRYVQKFPLNNSGKVDGNALAASFVPVLRETSLACEKPSTQLERRLTAVWEEVLKIDPKFKVTIGTQDPFAYLGGDSIKLMGLLRKIQEVFGVNPVVTQMGSLEELTIHKLARLIRVELSIKTAKNSIKLLKEGDFQLPPLFLLSPITGESSVTYTDLAKELKTTRRIYAINCSELVSSELMPNSIPELGKLYLDLIRRVQPQGKLHIAGWSSGGLLAAEVAAQEGSCFLAIIDEICPTIGMATKTNQAFSQELLQLMDYFSELYDFSLDVDRAKLATLTKEQQIQHVFSKIPEQDETRRLLLLYVKKFLLMSLTYQPTEITKADTVVFSSLSSRNSTTSKTLGWEKLIKQARYIDLDGNHFNIIEKPQQLTAQLQPFLQSIDAFKREVQQRLYVIQVKSSVLEESKANLIMRKVTVELTPLLRKLEELGEGEDRLLKEKISVKLVEIEKILSQNLLHPVQKQGFFKVAFPNNDSDKRFIPAPQKFIPTPRTPTGLQSKL